MTFKLFNGFNFTKKDSFQKKIQKIMSHIQYTSLYWHAYVHCTHLTYLAKIHGRFGWNAKPLTRGDFVSNLVSIFEAYLASLQNFARFKSNQSQITFQDFFREWRVVQTRPTELPLLTYQKSSLMFFLKVNFKIKRYFSLTYKLRK